jgi:purine-binding chemotaxis protein CheW
MELQQGDKYLTFLSAEEEYGIPIKKVKEIIGIMEITQLPKAPEFIKGVMNLRGKIIPVMDLRLKLGLDGREYNERTCIVVIEVDAEETKRQIGIVVDIVSEVVGIQAGDVEPPPEYGTQVAESFLLGIGKVKGRVVLLLDIGKLLNFAWEPPASSAQETSLRFV